MKHSHEPHGDWDISAIPKIFPKVFHGHSRRINNASVTAVGTAKINNIAHFELRDSGHRVRSEIYTEEAKATGTTNTDAIR